MNTTTKPHPIPEQPREINAHMTFTACPAHTHEMMGTAIAAIDAEHQRLRRRRTLEGTI